MMIYKIAPSVDSNKNVLKVPKDVKPTNKKTFGTSVINTPLSPLSFSGKKCVGLSPIPPLPFGASHYLI